MYTDPPVDPRPLPDFIVRPHLEALTSIRARVAAGMGKSVRSKDQRIGFGIVHATGPMHRCALTMDAWRWRHVELAEFPDGIGARRFVDDPMDVPPQTPLATRLIIADAFAEAANAVSDGADVVFASHALRIAAASPDRPPGISRGRDGDLLVVDLLEGEKMPAVIDVLMARELDLVRVGECLGEANHSLRLRLWHRAERINAARRMLGVDLPPIRIPGLAALERRIVDLTGSRFGHKVPIGHEG